MRKLVFHFIFFSFAFLSSCSDGDIIDVELDLIMNLMLVKVLMIWSFLTQKTTLLNHFQ